MYILTVTSLYVKIGQMDEKNQTVFYLIGELAKQAKVSLRTARFYQQKGLIKPSSRTTSGINLYSKVDIERVKLVKRLRNTGMSLVQILELFETDTENDYKNKVQHTLKVLNIEAENARKRMEELKQQGKEREEIIHLMQICLDCKSSDCPSECPPQVHIIQ